MTTSFAHRVEARTEVDRWVDRPEARHLGKKGRALFEMSDAGLFVPPAFVLSSTIADVGQAKDELRQEIAHLEKRTARRFGDPAAPLLVSVRSSPLTSMPGMLDTVLNVGTTSEVARSLGVLYDEPRFGFDVKLRFLESYAKSVLSIPRDAFDAVIGRRATFELTAEELSALVVELERLIAREAPEDSVIHEDPYEQLERSIEGVLSSWSGARATRYREAHGIRADEGTAVIVQAMAFGNLEERSGAAVVMSRHPTTGEQRAFGEWLPSVQGNVIADGRRTPFPLTRAQVRRGTEDRSLESAMPDVFNGVVAAARALEERFLDAVEVELTIERGELAFLQCRPTRRSARAAARIAVEMVASGSIEKADALARIEPASVRQLLTPSVPDPQRLAELGMRPLARGLAANVGAATGALILGPQDIDDAAEEPVGELILARAETSADDVETMRAVAGIVTAAGGLTCHAAVVARAMGKPCIVGASSLEIDEVGRRVRVRGAEGELHEIAAGTVLSIDGGRGLIYEGRVPVEPAAASPEIETILEWADAQRTMEVWAIAETVGAIEMGFSFGADRVFLRAGTIELTDAIAIVGDRPIAWLSQAPEDETRLARLRAGLDQLVLPLGYRGDAAPPGSITLDQVFLGDADAVPPPTAIAFAVAVLDVPTARLRAANLG